MRRLKRPAWYFERGGHPRLRKRPPKSGLAPPGESPMSAVATLTPHYRKVLVPVPALESVLSLKPMLQFSPEAGQKLDASYVHTFIAIPSVRGYNPNACSLGRKRSFRAVCKYRVVWCKQFYKRRIQRSHRFGRRGRSHLHGVRRFRPSWNARVCRDRVAGKPGFGYGTPGQRPLCYGRDP